MSKCRKSFCAKDNCQQRYCDFEAELRERIAVCADAMPEWSWTVGELRALAILLEGLVAARTADAPQVVNNVVSIGSSRDARASFGDAAPDFFEQQITGNVSESAADLDDGVRFDILGPQVVSGD